MFQIEPQSSKRPKFSEPLPNRKTHHKTEPCLKFQRGSCNYGDRCCFAHCIKQNEVIHIPIQNVPIAVDEKTNPRCNERTRFCWRYMSGERCQYGEKCHFIHVKSDGENDEMVNRKVLRWRTKICFRWMMTGSCRYGSSCCYAHGESGVFFFRWSVNVVFKYERNCLHMNLVVNDLVLLSKIDSM